MKTIRTIIIEDEFKPREALKSKLEKHPEIDIVAMCENTEDGFEKIVVLKPDLLFLDIEMPGKTGIELLELLKKAGITLKVIITTAYNKSDYYRKAMYLSTIDFLIKPVIAEELTDALERVKERIREEVVVSDVERLSLLNSSSFQLEFSCIVGTLFLRTEQIVYIKAEGNYSRIFLNDGKNELITESMKRLEEKFVNTSVLRVDRSHFINKFYVQKIVTSSNRCYFLSSVNLMPIELNETGVRNIQKL